MASLWQLLFIILPSLLLVAGYRLPSLKFPFQDGSGKENVVARGSRVQSQSPLGAPGRWEWKTGGDARHGFPPQPRRKRFATSYTHFETTTIFTQTLHNTGPGVTGARTSADAPTTITPMTTDVITKANTTVGVRGKIPVTTDDDLDDDTTEGITGSTPTTEDIFESDTTEGVMATGTILPQNSSIGGTGRTSVPIKEKMEVTTEKGPLVAKTTPSTSSQTLVGTTATPRLSTVALGPNYRAKGTVRGVSVTAKIVSVTAKIVSVTAKMASSTPTTIPAKLPSQKSPPIATIVNKCLLAIFLLALVAGIFIIISTVLAILLWRQKRAYKLNRQNHTEMVCISSLLTPDETEERHPRVRRMRMLGENASEAEMDNLTLNSFLPDH